MGMQPWGCGESRVAIPADSLRSSKLAFYRRVIMLRFEEIQSKGDGFSIGQRSYIRRKFREGDPVTQLADKYGVSTQAIIDVIWAGQKPW